MNMNKFALRSLSLAALVALSPVAGAADTAVTVNGKPLKPAQVEFLLKRAEANGQKVNDNIRRAVTESLINRELLVQEAEKAGLDKNPDFATRMEMMRQETLANEYMQQQLQKTPVDEAATREAYDKFKQQLGNKEYHLRQIVVASEEEAKSVIALLAKGGDFAKIAAEKSIDQATRDKGGDAGWLPPAALVRPLSGIVAGLQKGLYNTVPARIPSGWAVVKVEDVRDLQPPAYDKVKDRLAQQLRQEQAAKVVADLRAKAKISGVEAVKK
jgi:peptidyl-prolyl cis-trans isomerase C